MLCAAPENPVNFKPVKESTFCLENRNWVLILEFRYLWRATTYGHLAGHVLCRAVGPRANLKTKTKYSASSICLSISLCRFLYQAMLGQTCFVGSICFLESNSFSTRVLMQNGLYASSTISLSNVSNLLPFGSSVSCVRWKNIGWKPPTRTRSSSRP